MDVPPWLQEALTLALHLSRWQQFGLAFLLGSFAVATWSDLKYLAAQREFVEVWLFFLVCVLVYDVVGVTSGDRRGSVVLLKWALIGAFSVLSLRPVGWLFALAPGDVAALAAAASLLPPVLVLVFYLTAKVLARFIGPVLARGRRHYAFMPVVSLATLVVLLLGWVVS
jgi:hypothetical protein